MGAREEDTRGERELLAPIYFLAPATRAKLEKKYTHK